MILNEIFVKEIFDYGPRPRTGRRVVQPVAPQVEVSHYNGSWGYNIVQELVEKFDFLSWLVRTAVDIYYSDAIYVQGTCLSHGHGVFAMGGYGRMSNTFMDIRYHS